MEILAVVIAVGVGAFIKSITGMGLPPIAIPVLAIIVGPYDAIVIMTLSTVVTNAFLAWRYRDASVESRHLGSIIAAGVVGTPIGVYFLTTLSPTVVGLVLGVTVIIYVAFALLRPNVRIAHHTARRIAVPVGIAGGALQGATGLAGVVLASYIHALGIPPRAFVFMVTTLFSVFAAIQAGAFLVAGAYTTELIVASMLATAVAMVVLVFGTRLAPRVSPALFHRLVLAVLSLSAVKLIADALT